MDYRFEGRFRITEEEFFRAVLPEGIRSSLKAPAIGLLIAIAYFFLFTDRSFTPGLIFIFLALVGIAVAFPLMQIANVRKHYHQHPATAAPRRIELSSDGIVEDSEGGCVQTAWRQVDRVESRDGLLFLHTRSGGLHLIPERVFGSTTAAEAGRQFISSCVANVNFQPLHAKWFDVDRRGDETVSS